MKLAEQHKMYVRSMGKTLRVTAIFQDNEDGEAAANAHMAKSSNDDGVIAVFSGLIFLANMYDHGNQIITDETAT